MHAYNALCLINTEVGCAKLLETTEYGLHKTETVSFRLTDVTTPSVLRICLQQKKNPRGRTPVPFSNFCFPQSFSTFKSSIPGG